MQKFRTLLITALLLFAVKSQGQTYYPLLGLTIGVFEYHPFGRVLITHVEKKCPIKSAVPLTAHELTAVNGISVVNLSQHALDSLLNGQINQASLKSITVRKNQANLGYLQELPQKGDTLVISVPALKKEISKSAPEPSFYGRVNSIPEGCLQKGNFGFTMCEDGSWFDGAYRHAKGRTGNHYESKNWYLTTYSQGGPYSNPVSGFQVFCYSNEEHYRSEIITAINVRRMNGRYEIQELQTPVFMAPSGTVPYFIKRLLIEGGDELWNVDGTSTKGLLLEGEFEVSRTNTTWPRILGRFENGYPVGEFKGKDDGKTAYLPKPRGAKMVLCSCGVSIDGQADVLGKFKVGQVVPGSLAERAGVKQGMSAVGGRFKIFTEESSLSGNDRFRPIGECGVWGKIDLVSEQGGRSWWEIPVLYNIPLTPSASCNGNCTDGYGSKLLSDGDWYEGYWKGGKPQGWGVLISGGGQRVYKGSFEEGQPYGYGEESRYDIGSLYQGNFLNGRYEGYGKLTMIKKRDTGIYKVEVSQWLFGDFVDGRLANGWDSKQEYTGYLDEQGRPHGPGKKMLGSDQEAKGHFNHGNMDGEFIVSDLEDGIYRTAIFTGSVEQVSTRKWYYAGKVLTEAEQQFYEKRLQEKLSDYAAYQKKKKENIDKMREEAAVELRRLNGAGAESAGSGENACQTCAGLGTIADNTSETCNSCQGKSGSECTFCKGTRFLYRMETNGKVTGNYCSACRGEGKRSCYACFGTGKKVSLTVKKKTCTTCLGSGKRK